MSIVDTIKNNLLNSFDKLLDLLTGTFAGIVAYKLLVLASIIFLAALNVPAIITFVYAYTNEIPVFEAYNAIEDRIVYFTIASVFATFLVSVFAIGLGIAWFTDPALKNLPWEDKSKYKAIFEWTSRRWLFAFAPGLMLIFLILM